MADRQILTNTNGVVVRISSFWSRLVRTARWHRRGLSAALFGCAVLLALASLSPAPPASTRVVVAAHDLASGHTIGDGDLRSVAYPPELVPETALASVGEAVGRIVGSSVSAGTPITASTTVSTTITPGPGELLVAFRVSDAAVLRLVQVGDRVTVVSAGQDGQVVTLATKVRVATVPQAGAAATLGGSDESALLVIAADGETAKRVAAWSTGQPLSIALG